MHKLIVAVVVSALAVSAVADDWRIEVAADAPKVVSCRIDAKFAERMATHDLVAVGEDGRATPVEWAIDESGETPELVWLADGRQRFALRGKCASTMRPAGDGRARAPSGGLGAAALPVTAVTCGDMIVISNSFFSLQHPVKGRGGFPEKIRFVQSGATDDGLSFFDRFVRKNASGGIDVLPVRNDANSTARLVFNSPLRAVVEGRAKIADIEVVYRYVYSACSPLVRVDLQCCQKEGRKCSEAWTATLSWPRDAPRYSAYLKKAGATPTPFQEKDKKSYAFSDHWLAFTDGTNAVGSASIFGSVGWDASSSFVYYLLPQRDGWDTTTMARSALLYFGPALDRDGFDSAFAGVRPLVKVWRCPGAGRPSYQWVPTKPLSVRKEATLLEGKGIRLAFDVAEKGFNCIGIENRVNSESAAFVGEEPGRAGFWSLTFWKDGSPTNTLAIDNLAPCERKAVRRGDALVFDWRGLSLGDEHGVVDVRTKVSLSQDGTAAEWRIAVKNRSKRWGLAETTYPLLRNVVKPLEADVLIPKGNWAGRLAKSYQAGPQVGGSSLRYPTSLGAQIQTCAYLLGGTGLQVTSLDGRGQVKYFDMAGFDLGIRYPSPDQGVPGVANAPDFAVETAAFGGDWWTAAKRYRAWATRQKWAAKGPLATRADFNRQLGDVGYWVKNDGLHSSPQQITNIVARALDALPGIPLGLHWYCWHKCPFDNNYPELLPERPGMKEAVAWMKEKGVLVMPYINGRLWDDILDSYSSAVPSAVKNADGTCYIDKYGGHKFAVMCPTTTTWRKKLDDLCDTLENEFGVNALYLDQVSASMPAPCFDRAHGHPLGGGSHWTEGCRELMKPIRETAMRRGVALTSENAAEPYMDSFDAHLTWFGHSFDDVPMLPAVYSGYTVYFSSVSDKKDSLDSFCAQQGRDFIFGCQIGWNDPWILDDEHKEHLKFVERLSRERIAHKDFFLTGELLGELPTPPDIPTVEVKWNRIGMYYDSTRFMMPAVMGAEWRDHKGERRYFVLVNISGDEQTFSYGEGANRKVVTLSPRSVSSDICRMPPRP